MKRKETVVFRGAVLCMAFACWALAEGEERSPGEIRDILADVAATEYCGTAMMDGINAGTAIRGESPVAGRGFVRLEEAEYRPVLLEMAKEELAAYQEELPGLLETLRTADAACREALRRHAGYGELQEVGHLRNVADRNLNLPRQSFQRMLALLGGTEEPDDAVDAFLERVVKELPSECAARRTGIDAWVRRTLREQRAARCQELGAWLAERKDLEPMAHAQFRSFLLIGFDLCQSDAERGVVARYVLNEAEQLENYSDCNGFDMIACGTLPGWAGSLQRKRLAERFRDEPVIVLTSHWDEEKGEYVRNSPTQRDIDDMLWSRAAAELAADDSDLTDLREVYGDWTNNGEEK